MPYPILDTTRTTTTTKTARPKAPRARRARNAAISMVVRVFGEWSGAATPLEQLPAARERPAVGPKMIDAERTWVLASSLAADGYHLEVAEDLMRGILGQALGVPPDAIDLTYSSPSEQER